jgi:hypothetical protein
MYLKKSQWNSIFMMLEGFISLKTMVEEFCIVENLQLPSSAFDDAQILFPFAQNVHICLSIIQWRNLFGKIGWINVLLTELGESINSLRKHSDFQKAADKGTLKLNHLGEQYHNMLHPECDIATLLVPQLRDSALCTLGRQLVDVKNKILE